MPEGITSEKEAQNCLRVKGMLLEIPGLAVSNIRDDLFFISDPETGVEFTADVEEDILFLRADIAALDKELGSAFYKYLLELNAKTVHVAFGIDQDKLILRDNLEIDNLDQNELEASCKALVLTLYHASDEIEGYLNK